MQIRINWQASMIQLEQNSYGGSVLMVRTKINPDIFKNNKKVWSSGVHNVLEK